MEEGQGVLVGTLAHARLGIAGKVDDFVGIFRWNRQRHKQEGIEGDALLQLGKQLANAIACLSPPSTYLVTIGAG